MKLTRDAPTILFTGGNASIVSSQVAALIQLTSHALSRTQLFPSLITVRPAGQYVNLVVFVTYGV